MRNDYLTLAQAAKISPGRPHSSCVWRWARQGLKTRDGGKKYLKCIRAGSRLFTTEAWLQEFFEAVAEADQAHLDRDFDVPTPSAPNRRPRTAAQRRKAIEAAERELAEMGV